MILKEYYPRNINKIVIFIFTLGLLPIHFLFGFIVKDVNASQVVLTSVADTFVRENGPTRNYGSWNDITIGRSWNLGNYFSNAYGYVKFNLPGDINNQTVIESAYLEMYQYVRSDYASGNYLVKVARIASDWSELGVTWKSMPGFTGSRSQIWVDGYASQWFRPPKKYTWDVTSQVKEWAEGAPNYGFAIFKDVGNAGGFWCSRNYNNSTCFASTVPRLIINYSQNHAPNIPNPYSPQNMAGIGGDSSEQGAEITMKVKDLGDPEGNLDGTWFYYKREQDSEWLVSPKRTGQQTAQFTKFLPDAKWQWKARSVDSMGYWSNYSVTRVFTIDTTPPTQPHIISEPEFSPGTQNTVISSNSGDYSRLTVRYKFKVFEGENCQSFFYESNWQESQEFTIGDLQHDETYCYQVKSQDIYGNENSWSGFEKSRQDAITPQIISTDLSEEVISPNGDDLYETSEYSFNIVEEYFDHWNLLIKNIDDEVINDYQDVSKQGNILWGGTDNSNEIVSDGPYRFELHAYDKAGNESVDDSQVVIIDNAPATLNISQPMDGAWFNTDNVTIAGITEPESELTVNGKQYSVTGEGIFEEEEVINIGENAFEIISVDIVGNSSSKVITVNKELDSPQVSITSPTGLIKDQLPSIQLDLTDQNQAVLQSGIDLKSVYLSLENSDDFELVLLNEGQNIRHDLGHIETDCISKVTGGSQECSYSFVFDSSLQPDGDYRIKGSIADIAGNVSEIVEQEFALDSHTYLEVREPSEGSLFNHSKIAIEGEAERGSQLSIYLPTQAGNLQSSITINIDLSDERVTNCKKVREEFGVGWQGIKEICEFKIDDFQLEADYENDKNVMNVINVKVIDEAGNVEEEDITVNMNLYSVNLSIDSDLEYISPNGDGRQDGIEFTLNVNNRESGINDVLVDEWRILINDQDDQTDRTIIGENALPPNYYFDGKDDVGNWLIDGEYTYSLWIKTTDGIEFETSPVSFFVKTKVDGEVIITTPKNDTVTTKGVINVQGQAPLETVVTLCVDMIGIDGECNDEQILEVDTNGFFTGIVPLMTSQSYLWAIATDAAGNSTDKSNIVKVILDFSDSLINVQALPSLTGINQEVILRSKVSENTQYVKMRFADYSSLSELPEDIDWYKIGEIDNFSDLDLDDACDLTQCTWDYSWITPEVIGGVYEIRFIARKGEMYKTMSVGIRIDGTIPIVPMVLSLINANSLSNLREFESDYYTNNESIIVKGIAEPLTFVHLLVNDFEFDVMKSNAVGKWEMNVGLPEPEDYKNYLLTSVSSDNVRNQSEASLPVSVILDKEDPIFKELITSNIYHKSGTIADVSVSSNEPLFSGKLFREDFVEFGLSINGDYLNYIGSFTIESDASEGDYFTNVFIEDFAGNVSNDYLKFVIDNTKPEETSISISQWGKYNGVTAKSDIPAKGRLVPEYVIRGNEIILSCRAEQYSTVGIWLSSYKIGEIEVGDKYCMEETKAYGDVYYPLCDWEYKLRLGAFEKGYIIQTKVFDRAGNISSVSEGRLVYYDKTSPKKPKEIRSSDYWNDDGLGNITNKESIILSGEAERLSDTEVWVSEPSGKKDYYFFQNDPRSIWERRIKLGHSDGVYDIDVKSTDAAGNGSQVLNYQIERDTVKPAKPEVNVVGDEQNRSINLVIKGESNTKVKVHAFRSGIDSGIRECKIGGNGRLQLNNITRWEWGSNYKFEVTLVDRARNESDKNVVIYNTPNVGIGDISDNASILGESTDPYDGKSGNDYEKLTGTAKVYPDGRVELNMAIPAPLITHTYTDEDGKVYFWGIVSNRGNIRVEFYKKHEKNYWKDLDQAYKECGWKKYIPFYGGLIYAPMCVKKKYDEIQNRVEFDYAIDSFRFDPQNAIVQLFRSSVHVGGEVSVNLSDGRWMVEVPSGLVNSGDKVYIKARMWGYYIADRVEIHYNQWSRESNKVKVKEKPFIFDVAVSSVSDLSCSGYAWTSGYGVRSDPFTGEKKYHSGVDLAKWGGCKIVAVSGGNGRTGWYAGDTVFVKHNDIYETRYGHGAYYIGGYPRDVSRGEGILYMGQSGKATGVHLHFEVWENGKHMDPAKYFKFTNKTF
ncbi:DNRLRE domain-containing protein [Patescibacteria group bacterium]